MIKHVKNYALGLFVALFFFIFVETVLWIAGVEPLYERTDPYVGFSGFSPLFVEKTTADGASIYVTANNKMDWFNWQQFPARKANGVTRIFCLGGSTTYGRPYDDRTSFSGWLREFLPAVDPGRQWEVINAGGISYASYRVERLMASLLQHEPDLFIIYTGHNEFLEKRTYDQILKTPEFVRDLTSLASRLRLYSLLSDLFYERRDMLTTEVDAILDKSVGPEEYHRNDALRDVVLEHFRVSLRRMTSLGEKEGTGIIFVTPASNIRDFSPFKAEPAAGLDSARIQEISEFKKSISGLLDKKEFQGAADLAEIALAIDSRDAELLFYKGKALSALGRTDEARNAFVAARDEDIVPLRALTPIPGIVTEIALQNKNGLVDFARILEERSTDGIPGEEFFLDHVHPSIDANRILALAIIDEMIQTGVTKPASTWDDASISEITERVNSRVDEAANAMALTNLSRVLNWAGKQEEALRLAERATSMSSDQHNLFQMVTVLVRADRYEEALPYAVQASHIMPNIAAVRRTHGLILAKLGRQSEALPELQAAARLDPKMKDLYYHLALVYSDLGYMDQAEITYRKALELEPENADACNNLGVLFAQRGDLIAAKKLFEKALKAEPTNRNALDNLTRVNRMLGR